MPQETHRRRILRELEDLAAELIPLYHIQYVRSILVRISLAHRYISSFRYWERYTDDVGTISTRKYSPRRFELFDMLRGPRHIAAFRMDHPTLLQVVHFFKNDIVFMSFGPKPQAPPLYQIGVAIYRLAHGHDVRSISRTFSISGELFSVSACNSHS